MMNGRRRPLLLLLSLLPLATPPCPARAAAADDDGLRHALTDTVFVVGYRVSAGEAELPVADGDHLDRLLQGTPFTTIRRGAAGVADLYADGFKRQDITVTVDGERFVPACPNRMDTRAGQVDLLDIETASLSRNGAGLQSGLGGQVDLRRRLPGRGTLVYGRLGGAADHAGDLDASLAVEGRRTRLAGRLRRSDPTTDADGRTYADLYGYADAPAATVGELRAHRAFDGGDAQAAWESADDVLFPYLQMDERRNDHYQLSGSYRGHRAYVNRTDHLMDNALRTSWTATRMVTDATTTMLGAVGDGYEVYAHNWTADNRITPAANPAAATSSRMLPDVWRLGATATRSIGDPQRPWLRLRATFGPHRHRRVGRAGPVPPAAGGRRREPLVVPLQRGRHPCTRPVRPGTVHPVGRGRRRRARRRAAVHRRGQAGRHPRLGGQPAAGRPRARHAARRGRLPPAEGRGLRDPRLELPDPGAAHRRRRSPADLRRRGRPAGRRLPVRRLGPRRRRPRLELGREDGRRQPAVRDPAAVRRADAALAADRPLPGWAHYRHAAGQGRVDVTQGEWSTGAWNRLDLGATYRHDRFQLTLDLENATNALYVQHLSYQRSPFAAGARVHEPGRTLRATTTFAF
ncbi:MAG: hypothetical protein IPH09_10085 [bacterium]|nr:hypothetical protein [bacterium]